MSVQELIKASKALSDETRLRILSILLERECCVCEVMQALGISQSRASRNLGILEDGGFLTARREGTWVLYSLKAHSPNSLAASLTSLLEEYFADDEILVGDRERLRHSVRVGPGCGKGWVINMLEIKRSAVAFDENELLELEIIITDGDTEAALKFLTKVVYQKITKAQRAKLSSHLDSGGDPVERFRQGK
jgi:ArsR family transcriptional regulator